METYRSIVAYFLPITWLVIIVNHSGRKRSISYVAVCLSVLAGITSWAAFRSDGLAPSIHCLLSPFRHADYLHLCVNVFGGYIVLSKCDAMFGSTSTGYVLLIAYIVHVLIVALLRFFLHVQVDILGLSTLVFTVLGFILGSIRSSLSKTISLTFVVVLLFMTVIEVSIPTNLVHLIAMCVGFMLPLVITTINQEPYVSSSNPR